MTKRELIEALERYPDDMPVVVNAARNELANGRDVYSTDWVYQAREKQGDGWSDWQVDYFPELNAKEPDMQQRLAINIHS